MPNAVAIDAKQRAGETVTLVANDNLPPDYDQLMWFDKLDLFDPIALAIWHATHPMKLVPNREEAITIRLRRQA